MSWAWKPTLTGIASLLLACGQPQPPQPARPTEADLYAEYVGEDACKPCHEQIYGIWEASSHGGAMALPSTQTVAGDFVGQNVQTFRGTTYRMALRDSAYTVTIEEPGLPSETHRVDLVIGARQMQGYLTRMPDGRLQELPIACDLRTGAWIEASAGGVLPSGARFSPRDRFYWKNPGRTWNIECFNCHASQIARNYDPKTNTYRTTWVDLSINCEACHGPGARHVAFWDEALKDASVAVRPDTTLVNLALLDASKSVEACVQCHAKKTISALGYRPGDEFSQFYEPALLDDAGVWPDGLFRSEVYTYIGYLLNRCYLKGGLTCTHCHDPHGSVHRVDMRVSRTRGSQLCANCHQKRVSDPEPHTHHPATGAGGGCLDCHMPAYELQGFLVEGMRFTDHRLTPPVPENTVRMGIPNACNRDGCHADRTPAWASEWCRRWHGDYQSPRVATADAIHKGKRADPEALAALAEILADTVHVPALRASAATLLARLGSADAVSPLISALASASPLVRSRATLALGRFRDPHAAAALAPMLRDPNLFVRVNAAMALNAQAQPVSPETAGDFRHAFEEYLGLLTGLWADDPGAHLSLGDIHLSRNQPDRAADAYRNSLRIWPHNPDAYVRMARVYLPTRRPDEALDELRKALDLKPGHTDALSLRDGIFNPAIARLRKALEANPFSARVRHNLATFYAQKGMLDEAIAEYRKAVGLRPDYAVAHRNLGMACAERGLYADALTALRAYLKYAPNARDARDVRELIAQIEATSGQ